MHPRGRGQRTVTASQFKDRCLSLIDEVNETGEEIVITRHGKPVARLIPAKKPVPEMWGRYREQVHIVGDIMSSGAPDQEWEAISNPDRVLDPGSTTSL